MHSLIDALMNLAFALAVYFWLRSHDKRLDKLEGKKNA